MRTKSNDCFCFSNEVKKSIKSKIKKEIYVQIEFQVVIFLSIDLGYWKTNDFQWEIGWVTP